jgi:hypothetical protein
MKKQKLSAKHKLFYFFEFVYVCGAFMISFVPYELFIWKFGLIPVFSEYESGPRFMISLVLVCALVPISIFALLLDLYVKKIKRISRTLQKYGFLGKRRYWP